MFFSPIDEFEMHPVFFTFCESIFCFLPINLMFFFLFFLILFVCNLIMFKTSLIQRSFFERFFEEFYLFINRILIQNYRLNGEFSIYFPFLFYLFFFILFVNLLGIVPGGFTNTAFILHNFLITASIILGITIMGFLSLGFKTYINFFVLKGLPFLALCFLFVLEVISHTAKAFSLSIRLFANMTAGHTLMHILAGGIVNILKLPFFGFIGLIPFAIFVLVCVMELGISILQAYVFFILIIIYFNEGIQTSQYQSLHSTFIYKKKRKQLKTNIK